MTTRRIYLAKVERKDTTNGEVYEGLKEITFTVPKNVIDVEYFREAVQFHILNVAVEDTLARLDDANQKVQKLENEGKKFSIAWDKAQDNRNKLGLLAKYLGDFTKVFDLELSKYKDVNEVKRVMLADSFAKVYAWTLGGYKSRKRFIVKDEAKNGKLEDIAFHYENEDTIISLLKDFNLASIANAPDRRKDAAKQIELYANQMFGTRNNGLYKTMTYKFTATKINNELYTRFKNDYKHDFTGNIKDTEKTAFQMVTQLYFMCLLQLGVPSINGEKIRREEIITCNPDEENKVITLERKKEEK